MSGTQIPRRRVLQSSAAAITAGLAGCLGDLTGGDGGDGGGGDMANKIAYWNIHNGDDFRGPINDIIGNYEDETDRTVEKRYIDNDDIETQLSSAVASDTLPNVGLFAIQTIQRLGADGNLSSEYPANVVESVGEDDFRDGPLQFMSAPDGGYYGVPADAWVQGIWYRKDLFEEEGLDAPVTWDQIRTAAETLHDPGNDVYGIGFGTKNTAYARQCFTQIARSNGALVIDENANVVFDSAEMVEALQFTQDLFEYVPGAVSFDDNRNLYGNDQMPMFFYSSYLMPDLLQNDGEEMVSNTGLAPATENARASTYGQVLGHCIFEANDAKLATSEDFVEHVMTGDSYITWVHTNPGGTMPVLQSTAEKDAYQDNDILSAWSETIPQISEALGNMERFDFVGGKLMPEFGQITSQNLVSQAVNRVTVKEHDPETVASEQAEKMRNALS